MEGGDRAYDWPDQPDQIRNAYFYLAVGSEQDDKIVLVIVTVTMAAKVGTLTVEDELVWSLVASDEEEVLWRADSLVHIDVVGAEVVDGGLPLEAVIPVCDKLNEGDPLRDRVVVPVSEPDERPEAVRVIKVVALPCWSETQPTLPTSCRLVEPRSPAPPVRST